jgi:hypothetical protein
MRRLRPLLDGSRVRRLRFDDMWNVFALSFLPRLNAGAVTFFAYPRFDSFGAEMTTCYDHEWHKFENGECDQCEKKAASSICRLCGMQACRFCRGKITLARRREDEDYVAQHYKKRS